MANNTPTLDLTIIPSYSSALLIVADISQYPTGFNISTPTIEITPPGFIMKSIAFTPQNVQIYNAESLDITCDDCTSFPLPDGIWKIKYSVTPAYLYFVEKNFLRVDKLIEKYDTAYLKLDILQCDQTFKREQKYKLDLINAYIEGAIASANKCALKQAMDLYNRADRELTSFLKNFDHSSSCNKVW